MCAGLARRWPARSWDARRHSPVCPAGRCSIGHAWGTRGCTPSGLLQFWLIQMWAGWLLHQIAVISYLMHSVAQSLLRYGLGMGILIPGLASTVVGVVSFAVVFVCMTKVLLPRINKVLGERRDAIEGQMERAEQLAAEAGEVFAKYREELAEARHEAARLRQEALEEGTQLIAEIRVEGLREREAMIVEAQARLAADRVIAETELRADVVSLATELAGRIVGEALESVADSEIVDRFFSDIDARSAQ